MPKDLNEAIDQLGAAFEEFKASNDQRLAEIAKKGGAADVLLEEKVSRIDAALEALTEQKAKIDARLKREQEEREALELRLTHRPGKGDDAAAAERKAFDDTLKAVYPDRRQTTEPAAFDAYKAAFRRYLRKETALLTGDEIKSMEVGSDPSGGYLVTPDMGGRIVTRIFETSPIRQIAGAVTISTDSLQGIEDTNEAGAGWAGETETVAETTTPDLGKWSIPVHEARAEPRATQKILDDAMVNVEQWLADKVADRMARLENTAFVTGNGVNRPRGFTTYTAAADSGTGVTWGSIGYVATGTSGAFPAANPADRLHDVVGLLKDAYLGNARWVTRRSVVTLIRKFKDGQGQYLWSPGLAGGVPETILSFPITRAEDMPAVGADSLSLAFGNFAVAYQIVDRAGIRVLRDPYTAKPYVKFFTTKRVGGAVVNFEALKFLKFGAS